MVYSDDSGEVSLSDEFLAVFEFIEEIVLEETGDVITVAPAVFPDGNGNLLVADAKEQQIREYSATGQLVSVFGQEGDGPGEFRVPVSARRTASGNILVVDFTSGRLSEVSPDLDSLLSSTRLPTIPSYDATEVENKILLAGHLLGSTGTELLHLWNPTSSAIEKSFFPQPGGPAALPLKTSFGTVSVSINNDRVAAVSALTDSVYLFSVLGEALETIHIPIRSYIPPGQVWSESGPISGRELPEFINSLTLINGVFWMADGRFLIQVLHPEGYGGRWEVVGLDPSGQLLFSFLDSPRILAVWDGFILMENPISALPNHLVKFRLRSQE